MARQVLTPLVITDLSDGSGATYWKHVLPETEINYTDNTGRARTIDFNDSYLDDLTQSFEQGALDETPFMLADADNKHTMDPERQRGTVVDMRKADELPGKVRARIVEKFGKVAPGLWTKIKFPSAAQASAVMKNPNLGVSARIREDIARVDGKNFKRAVIHVLGTLDPKITGLQGWLPATDLSSEYAHDDVLDLSHTEAPVAKTATLPKKNAAAETSPLDGIDIENLTAEDISEFTDEQLNAFLAFAAENDADGDDDPEDDTDPEDDPDDDLEDDPDAEPQEAKLSVEAKRQIDLANSRAEQALRMGRDAQARAAKAQWDAYRETELAKGVEPWVLDLAEPVLNRFDDMVIDLSNEDGDNINVGEIVRKLITAAEGTVDLATLSGHVGSDGSDDDPDAEMLTALAEITP